LLGNLGRGKERKRHTNTNKRIGKREKRRENFGKICPLFVGGLAFCFKGSGLLSPFFSFQEQEEN
jgi:hypothetical protein